jgi:hypothetical protein
MLTGCFVSVGGGVFYCHAGFGKVLAKQLGSEARPGGKLSTVDGFESR